ncbi:hypothetical protein [Pseudoluteimonas lycopersici]|uniref:hypothetical protein n=1 Tax=Pseudoluteimonas lycopersici TaxID=1324796 RepID=UPI0031EB4034
MLCLLPGLVRAENTRVMGTSIDLPFEYALVGTEDSSSNNALFSAVQWKRIEVTDKDGTKHRLQLVASYTSSDRLSNTAMEDVAEKASVEQAAKPGVRSSTSLEVDGFPFHFIEGPADNKQYPQRMSMSGVINGALYQFSIMAGDQGLLTEELAKRVKAISIDYAQLLKLRPAFEEESKAAVVDGVLDTPLNRIRLDASTRARLSSSVRMTDAAGTPVFRVRGFSLFKAGFWTMQNLMVYVGCGSEEAYSRVNEGNFLAMNDGGDDEDDEHYVDVSVPESAILAGLPARTATARGGKAIGLRRTSIRRWEAKKDGTLYQAGLIRLNGSPIEKLIGTQLETGPATCQLGLNYGAGKD